MASAARREEVPAVGELTVPDLAYESQISLVNESGRVESVPGGFGGHSGGSQLAQFVVNEREQLGRGVSVASLGRFEELSDLGHVDRVYSGCSPGQPRNYVSANAVFRRRMLVPVPSVLWSRLDAAHPCRRECADLCRCDQLARLDSDARRRDG